MIRVFEFLCDDGHLSEIFVDSGTRTQLCKHCGKAAQRVVSAGHVRLDGISGDFPGAADKWVRLRAEKLKQERKQSAGKDE